MSNPTIDMAKAHDVRHLCRCCYCGGIGDDRYMPVVNGDAVHGFCAIDLLGGVNGVAALPPEEYGKISLGEIGAEAMRKLCDATEARRPSAMTFD